MFWSEAPPVRTSQSQDSERAWMERVVTSRSNSLNLLAVYGPDGWCGRTSPASCRLTTDGHLEPSSEGWQNSGMGSPTEFLTLSTSEWPRDAAVCSLSDILETGDVPQRYFLSATACRGILRRAEKRGKQLPASLERALRQVAKGGGGRIDGESETFVATVSPTLSKESFSPTKSSSGQMIDFCVTHALRADGFDASEDGTGRGTPLVPCLTSNGDAHSGFRDEHGLVPVVGWNGDATPKGMNDLAPCMKADQGGEGCGVSHGMAVRRLTPLECCRLQGFNDHFFRGVLYRGKPPADGPMYKALGNSMAVPVMAWIGRRIQEVDAL